MEIAFRALCGARLAASLRPGDLTATATNGFCIGIGYVDLNATQRRTLDATAAIASSGVGTTGVRFGLCKSFSTGEAELLAGKG